MTRLLATLLLLLCAAFGQCASAQAVAGAWVVIPGSARVLAVGDRGTVGAIDSAGTVSRREPRASTWQVVGRDMTRLAVDAAGTFWAIDRQGTLQRLEGTVWRAIGQGAAALAAAPDGTLVVVTDTGSLARFDTQRNAWTAIPGNASRVAVDARGLVWTVAADGAIARRLGDSWVGVAGRAREIAADVSGNVVIAGQDGKIYEWIEGDARWSEITGADSAVAVGTGGGALWRADADGRVHAKGIRSRNELTTGDTGPRASRGTTDKLAVPDASPLEFTRVATQAGLAALAIGHDGSVYGLTADGAIRRWSGSQRRFNAFPGTLKRLGVDTSGLPYGVGAGNAFVRHDGAAWRLMRLNAALSDVSIPGAGHALAVYADGQLYRVALNGEQAVGTDRLAGNVERAYLALDGSFWYRNSAALLFRCDRLGTCQRESTRAADLAIGPGGTVFMVDESGNLLRVNAAGQPEIVRRGTTLRVAVGPNDRPWIIEKNGDVLAARLFERDEAVDLQLARATEITASVTTSDPAGTGGGGTTPSSGVTFNQFSFIAVEVPTSAPGFPNLGRGLLDISVGLDDQIIVTGFDATADPCNARTSGWKGRNWIYSPLQRRFVHLDALKGVQYQVALAGRTLTFGNPLPAISAAPSVPAFYGSLRACERYYTVEYRTTVFAGSTDFFTKGGDDIGQSSLTTKQVTVSTRDLTTVMDMDVTVDGWLVTIFPQRKIQFIKLGADYPGFSGGGEFPGFSERKFARVSVGATRDTLWATDFDSDVYEYVKATNRFEKRNLFANDRAQDIGVGKDGSVFIVDLGGNLKKWNPALKSWLPTGRGGVTRVAVTSKGKPVVANFPNSQRVFIAQ